MTIDVKKEKQSNLVTNDHGERCANLKRFCGCEKLFFPPGGRLWLDPTPTLTQEGRIAERESSGLGSVRAISFDEYAADLLRHRVFADEQSFRDLLIRFTLRDQS